MRRRDVVARAVERLAAGGVASPDHDAAELLAHVLGTSRGALVLVDEVDDAVVASYDVLVGRRAAREPLQHLTGVAGFRYVELAVGPGVFVPRPETELLAGWAVQAAGRLAAPVVVDLCTGSGAIARSVAHEVPRAVVHAVELDEGALVWAARNLEGTGVDLRSGSMDVAFDDLAGTVDVVVCNPPYIPLEAWESGGGGAPPPPPPTTLTSPCSPAPTGLTRCASSSAGPGCSCGPGEWWDPSTPTSRVSPLRRCSRRRAVGATYATTATSPGVRAISRRPWQDEAL